MTQDHRLIQELTPRNLLSFGPDTTPIPLHSLNVLIGANGSGKSNFIEAILLLRATAGDVRVPIREGGGVTDWIWKGSPYGEASLEAVVTNAEGARPLRHVIRFGAQQQAFHLLDETIADDVPGARDNDRDFYYRYAGGRPLIKVNHRLRQLPQGSIQPDVSILAQRRDPESFPAITYLSNSYERIRVYRNWVFGRNTVFRAPQKADMRKDRLEEDYSNLGLFLNRLRGNPQTRRAIQNALGDLYSGLLDFDLSIEGGTVQVFFMEGNFNIPATRLSDGTLRYICLLAVLLDPEPPPLVCIEEPELGLHPDIVTKVADLLRDASQRTQIVITTHSDILVDALTDNPEDVLICEKHEGQTSIRRLEREKLQIWLDQYRLGELWTRGEIGGTRW